MARPRLRRAMRPHAVRIAPVAVPATLVTALSARVPGAVTRGDDVKLVYPVSASTSAGSTAGSARAGAGSQSPRVEDSEAGLRNSFFILGGST